MKKYMKIGIIIFIMIYTVICFKEREIMLKNTDNLITNIIEKGEGRSIVPLNEMTDFEWETIFIFPKYFGMLEMYEYIGFKPFVDDSFHYGGPDDQATIVFMNKSKVVANFCSDDKLLVTNSKIPYKVLSYGTGIIEKEKNINMDIDVLSVSQEIKENDYKLIKIYFQRYDMSFEQTVEYKKLPFKLYDKFYNKYIRSGK